MSKYKLLKISPKLHQHLKLTAYKQGFKLTEYIEYKENDIIGVCK